MMQGTESRIRYWIFRAVAVCAFGFLILRLWNLQVVSFADYQHSADQNRFRLVPADAPRGIIYDRFGRKLVRNIPSFTVSIVPAGLPEDEAERRAVLERVGQVLGIPVTTKAAAGSTEHAASPTEAPTAATQDAAQATEESPDAPEIEGIEEILAERTVNPYSPVRIVSNADRQAAFILEEEHVQLPGVIVEARPLREYIEGPLTAHILGYVGSIPSDALPDYVGEGYQPDDLVGLTGIERTQERILRGTKGQKHIEVDAFERQVALIAASEPVQGENVVLTLDVELQRMIEGALREGMQKAKSKVGVVVAMDPRTGEVLAMVSLPNYDNNLFSGGISYDDYALLSNDKQRPLVNHAISGQYPPGSTFKIVAASGGLEEGVIQRNTLLTCPGTILLPNKYFPDNWSMAQPFYCWHRGGHGALNVVGGIRNSCDIYFYQVAGGFRDFEGLGIDRLSEYMSLFGFGKPTGVELSGEASGLVPTDRWKRQTYGETWVTGDTYNAAIGQGFVLATPLQVLNATAAIANGGTLYQPQLVYQISDAEGHVSHALQPEPILELPVAKENIALVRQGMREAVTTGTAFLMQIPSLTVAGKTGTAEYAALDEAGNVIRDAHGNLPTHAWFTAFAPFEDPEIALVVFLEGGGEGSQTAVPVAAKILRYYFGIPEPGSTAPAAPPGGDTE